MESDDGSREPCRECRGTRRHKMDCTVGRQVPQGMEIFEDPMDALMLAQDLTPEELAAVADGEPYCFRCGKPASSFREYDDPDGVYTRVEMVHNDEGTWNPATNRFACDACYIAIDQPTAPGGWKAP